MPRAVPTHRPLAPISVRIVAYKFEQWLPGCLDALLQQSVQPHSVVVSDDCSPEPHGEAFRALAARYPHAQFRQPPHNLGPVLHMRHLLADVDAPYYLLFSGDDTLVGRDFLAQAAAILDQHPQVVAVFGGILPVSADGRPLRAAEPMPAEPHTILPAQTLRDALAFDNVVPAVATVIRTAAHQKVPPFPINNALCHDWLQWYLLTFAGDFARINQVVTHYRVLESSVSNSIGRQQRYVKLVDEAYGQLLSHPWPSAGDRRLLERGRMRKQVHHARAAELWRPMLRHAGEPTAWMALGEALAERGQARLAAWQERLHRSLTPKL